MSESPDSDSAKSDTAGKWILTEEAYNKLLACFSLDREEAGRQLNLMGARLLHFFERRRCLEAEELIDKTIDTVARRIDEGENIYNLPAYFMKVAQFIYKEWLNVLKKRPRVPLDDVPEIPDRPPPVDDLKEARLRCLDECRAKLSAENRRLSIEYYTNIKREKIDHRRELAGESTMNALRIRTCRINKGLEKCVKECLKLTTDSK